MVQLLEQMLRNFKDSNPPTIDQKKDYNREAAKRRAFELILNAKMIANKIMADELKSVD